MNEPFSIGVPAYIEAAVTVDWARFYRVTNKALRALKRAPRRKRKIIRERAQRQIRACILGPTPRIRTYQTLDEWNKDAAPTPEDTAKAIEFFE